MKRMEWQERAACKGCTKYFFPVDDETEPEKRERVTHAKTICLSCPVRSDCLDDALRFGQNWGIRAGKTPRELRDMRSIYLKERATA